MIITPTTEGATISTIFQISNDERGELVFRKPEKTNLTLIFHYKTHKHFFIAQQTGLYRLIIIKQ